MSASRVRRDAQTHVAIAAARSEEGAPKVIYVIGCRLLALVCLAALCWLLAHYPPGALWVAPPLMVYAVLLWRKPALWLFAVPALLPVLDFSPWTGWFFLRESDFLVLATLAIGYWRIVPQRVARYVSPTAKTLLVLLIISYAISTYLGLGSPPPIDSNSFANYQSPYNSLRVLLGFAWAILLFPLLTRTLDDGEVNMQQYFVPGVTAGLALAALVTAWERLAFPGLLDFALDYRATGSFPEMHVGGAALDGYLMLTIPFAAVWALKSRNVWSVGFAAMVFALGTYATLATFTRSTYFAYALVITVVVVGFLMASRMHSRLRIGGATIMAALVFLLVAYIWVRVFSTGGYRTLAAAFGMYAAAYFVGAVALRKPSMKVMMLTAPLLCGMMIVMMALWARSIYISYAIALCLLAFGLLMFWSDRERRRGVSLAMASFPMLVLGTVLIAWHWGGNEAALDATLLAVAAVCLVVCNRLFAAKPLWTLSRDHVVATFLVALALAMVIPVMGNQRMKERFSEVGGDFSLRISHWRDGLAMISPGWVNDVFGMGLGSFPRNYFWGNRKGEIPGMQTYLTERGNSFLRLGGPHYNAGFGEALRVFQMVPVQSGRTYLLSLDVRSNVETYLGIDICEKWTIYPVACANQLGLAGTKVGKGEWQHIEKVVHSSELGRSNWFGKRPIHLLMFVEKAGTYVEIDNLVLSEDAGRNLVKNGDFSDGHAWWFFSSDREHLPWHAKSLLLHVLFEQGWVGVVLTTLLLFYALCKYARRMLNRDLLAVAPLAALAGFLVVGAFDSLLDFPRLTLLFYLLLFVALIPAKATIGHGK